MVMMTFPHKGWKIFQNLESLSRPLKMFFFLLPRSSLKKRLQRPMAIISLCCVLREILGNYVWDYFLLPLKSIKRKIFILVSCHHSELVSLRQKRRSVNETLNRYRYSWFNEQSIKEKNDSAAKHKAEVLFTHFLRMWCCWIVMCYIESLFSLI